MLREVFVGKFGMAEQNGLEKKATWDMAINEEESAEICYAMSVLLQFGKIMFQVRIQT